MAIKQSIKDTTTRKVVGTYDGLAKVIYIDGTVFPLDNILEGFDGAEITIQLVNELPIDYEEMTSENN